MEVLMEVIIFLRIYILNPIMKVVIEVFGGTSDAIVGLFAIVRLLRDQRSAQNANNISKRLFECIVLNGGVFLMSILVFNYLILNWLYLSMQLVFGSQHGLLSNTWFYLEPTLSYFFSFFWVLPLFLLSRVVNALWFQDIADNAFRGRPQGFRNIPIVIADTLFSLLIQILFLIQSMAIDFLPLNEWITWLAALFHISLLYSLYSFEYKWFNMGWELHRRLHFIENNWTYFVGFGLPLAMATYNIKNYLLSGAIFSILFPLFIISANEARPRYQNNDFKIRVFSPVVWLSNKILFFVFKSRRAQN